MTLHTTLEYVTERIIERSRNSRRAYLEKTKFAESGKPSRNFLSCSNLAHGFASCAQPEKKALAGEVRPNIAIISAYNDMLSAHQPLEHYPNIIKEAAWNAGGVAQFAGGVPAMCDGITQGQTGMELSLFSRDVIAMATAVSLSHNMFDAVLCLGVCDKIVPGMLMGALSFGHLPVIFVPAGPMPSGLTNSKKAMVRQAYAEGKVAREELLQAESESYHSPGTCTFYGTANSNQLLMEFMGLHLPGTSFINPGTPLRAALTRAAAQRAVEIARMKGHEVTLARVIDEKSIINGMVGLLASGGSTNHTMHLVAIARAAGIVIDWDDFAGVSEIVPLLARVYPNGKADVNHFQAAGGVQLLIRELLNAGLLHPDVMTVAGEGLEYYLQEPFLESDQLVWKDGSAKSLDRSVVASTEIPFARTGGIRLLRGNLGRAIVKVSAVNDAHRLIEAPALVFESQEAVLNAFKAGQLERDAVIVVRNQGPRANGMPELHKLTPALGVLQDKGFKVALVTDGRMSGASGKVSAAIQVTPESLAGGTIAKILDGDRIRVDTCSGELSVMVAEETLSARPLPQHAADNDQGCGRELFHAFRQNVTNAEHGASIVVG